MLVRPPKDKRSLGVIWIAAALAIAAFLGAAVGLVWQSSGFADRADQPADADQADEEPEAVSSQ